RRLVPTREDAADVTQGIALVLWKKFHELEDPEAFRKWAFGVARYETLAWRRDRARDRCVLSGAVLETVASEAEQRDERLQAQREALEDCLETLKPNQRELLLDAYAPGTPMPEVAARSGKSVNAFYQWMHRMRQKLVDCTRRRLRAEGFA
ncbi:MAG: sigma-70 family RNA polymerase sigma factor, partial [Planctomycetota bacterium]